MVLKVVVTVLMFSSLGCNFRHMKMQDDLAGLGGGGSSASCDPVLFSTINERIFVASNCKGCHGSQFSTYEAIKSQADLLKVWLPQMPSAKPQSLANQKLFQDWVNQGFPQTPAQADLTACSTGSFDPVTPPASGEDNVATPPVSTEPLPSHCGPVYQTVAEAVFKPRCTACHGTKGGVNLESYAEVKSNLTLVKAVIASDEMPPGSPLSPEQKTLLQKWIQAGAPEKSDDPLCQGTAVEPVVTVLEPTFKSLNEKIFLSRCTVCHNGSANIVSVAKKGNDDHHESKNKDDDENLDFRTYEKMKSYGSELFDIERPEKSKIVKVVVKGRMPPSSTGIQQLSAEEIAVLKEWIRLGLPKE